MSDNTFNMDAYRRHMFILYVLVSLIVNGNCMKGRTYKKTPHIPPRCFGTKLDPSTQPNTHIDSISGKLWHFIRQTVPNPSDVFVGEFTNLTDGTARWFYGTDTEISTTRKGRGQGYCESLTIPFKKIPGRNAYTFFGSATQSEEEFRIIHHSQEYLITWVCFEFGIMGNCLNSGARIYRDRPNFDISSEDLARLDLIVLRSTCELTVSRHFTTIFSNRQACPDLMLPGTVSLYK